MFDTTAGGTYIETALTSIGVSSEQLIENLTKRIISNVKETGTIVWPPAVDKLEKIRNSGSSSVESSEGFSPEVKR